MEIIGHREPFGVGVKVLESFRASKSGDPCLHPRGVIVLASGGIVDQSRSAVEQKLWLMAIPMVSTFLWLAVLKIIKAI